MKKVQNMRVKTNKPQSFTSNVMMSGTPIDHITNTFFAQAHKRSNRGVFLC
jgi:hypothetical protein